LINEKGSKRGRLKAITENRGDNQGNEKKGKTCTRRSSTGKKEGRKACVLWCPLRKETRFIRRTGLVKSEKATGRSSYTIARHST
jgi:hypothetical protein